MRTWTAGAVHLGVGRAGARRSVRVRWEPWEVAIRRRCGASCSCTPRSVHLDSGERVGARRAITVDRPPPSLVGRRGGAPPSPEHVPRVFRARAALRALAPRAPCTWRLHRGSRGHPRRPPASAGALDAEDADRQPVQLARRSRRIRAPATRRSCAVAGYGFACSRTPSFRALGARRRGQCCAAAVCARPIHGRARRSVQSPVVRRALGAAPRTPPHAARAARSGDSPRCRGHARSRPVQSHLPHRALGDRRRPRAPRDSAGPGA